MEYEDYEDRLREVAIFAIVERDKYWKGKIKEILKKSNAEDIRKALRELIK